MLQQGAESQLGFPAPSTHWLPLQGPGSSCPFHKSHSWRHLLLKLLRGKETRRVALFAIGLFGLQKTKTKQNKNLNSWWLRHKGNLLVYVTEKVLRFQARLDPAVQEDNHPRPRRTLSLYSFSFSGSRWYPSSPASPVLVAKGCSTANSRT